MDEIIKKPGELIAFYLFYLVSFAMVIIPIYFFKRPDTNTYIICYISGIFNSSAVQQFCNLIVGKIKSGEYEALLLTPVSTISLYLYNLLGIILLLPIILILFFYLKTLGTNINSSFLFGFFLIFLSNAGLSIIIAGVHLFSLSMEYLKNIISIIAFMMCIFTPIILSFNSIKRFILFIPWANCTSLLINMNNKILTNSQYTYTIIFLFMSSITVLLISLRFYKYAQNRKKKDGYFQDEARRVI